MGKLQRHQIYSGYIERGNATGYDYQVGDFTTDDSWNDLDLSSIVTDSDAKLIIGVCSLEDNAAGSYFMLRPNGNADIYNRTLMRTQVSGVAIDFDFQIGCDSSQVVEYRGAALAFVAINVVIKGWFI